MSELSRDEAKALRTELADLLGATTQRAWHLTTAPGTAKRPLRHHTRRTDGITCRRRSVVPTSRHVAVLRWPISTSRRPTLTL